MATLAFNKALREHFEKKVVQMLYEYDSYDWPREEQEYFEVIENALEKGAMFDARVFNIPKEEVANCFIWRQQDATRNAIQMLGQTYFSHKELDKKSKKDTIIVTLLFGILAGFWCMGWGGFEELAPLISNKIGYLNAVYTILEIILLCIISGSLLQKINKKKKLLFTETIIACIDVSCLLIASLTLSWQGLLIAYIITAFTSTMGDPIWGSIMSAYSTNDRAKWVIVNRVYFVIRAIFTIITWYICRECVIRGIESFRYLSIILIGLIIITYLIASKINKKVFGSSI
jgi:hypothetical protein